MMMLEKWESRFSGEEYVYGVAPNDFLRENVSRFPKGAKILCIAEGEGRNAVFLAGQGFDVHAVDLTQSGRKKAMQLAEKNNVSIGYDVSDLLEYDMGHEKWDVIVSIFAHTPSAVRDHTYRAVRDALKPGGMLLLEGYNVDQLQYGTGGPSDVDQMFDLSEIQSVLSGFTFEIGDNAIREIHEGSKHTGKSAVVQVIARK